MNEETQTPEKIRHYRGLAKRVVMSYFGKEASRLVYKSTGRTNHVFVVNHVEGQFVIRISPDSDKIDSFRKELWVTQHVRAAGVPSQEVLAVDQIDSEPFMIARRVAGREAVNHPRRKTIVHEIGKYAAMINSIELSSFGTFFDWGDAQSQSLNWNEFLEKEWDAERRLEVLRRHGVISQDKVDSLRSILDELKTSAVKPALTHGDLRLKNVIVDDDGQITAIIDWDDCLATMSPAWELSIALHDLTIDEKNSFIEGYGIDNKAMTEIAPAMRFFNIMNYYGAVEAAVEKDDLKSLDNLKLRLSGCLDLYSF